MKKLKYLFIAALAAFTLNACEDVPAPYTLPIGGGNGGDEEIELTGTNLLANASFEEWASNKPTGWAGPAHTATIEQSNDAQDGASAVVIKGDANSNKRFTSQEYALKAGTYAMAFYVKNAGSEAGKYSVGYAKLTNGTVADTSNDYIYIEQQKAVTNEWQQVVVQFTLDKDTNLALIIMNSKYGNGAPILVDNVILVTNNGGTNTPEEIIIPDTPSPIADVIANGDNGQAARIEGTIVATYSKGFLVKDDTGYILVYLGAEHTCKAGDIVTVGGKPSEYNGMLQFGATSIYEVKGTTTFEHPTPIEYATADFEQYAAAPSIVYVKYNGTFVFDSPYYNVNIGSETVTASISYPNADLFDEEALNGKTIEVYGYLIGTASSGKYANTMATSVAEPAKPISTYSANEFKNTFTQDAEDKLYLSGYIVGCMQRGGTVNFGVPSSKQNTLLIADDPEETNKENCVIVDIANMLNELNLKDNADSYKKKIKILGYAKSHTTYNNEISLREIEAYEIE